jgi:hypothetical protein
LKRFVNGKQLSETERMLQLSGLNYFWNRQFCFSGLLDFMFSDVHAISLCILLF